MILSQKNKRKKIENVSLEAYRQERIQALVQENCRQIIKMENNAQGYNLITGIL